MANLPENGTWEDGIYQLETTDPVVGGVPNPATGEGIDNVPLLQLANRTGWLKQRVDGLLNSVVSLVPTGRKITAGNGLSGGGDLSADRSLSVDFATSAETLAGSLANKTVSPATLKARIDALIDSAPGALDTLNELALAVQENDGEIATALAQLATSMRGANNLSELTDPAQARANIGAAATLTQAAVSPFLAPTSQNVVGATILAEYTGPLPIQFGDLCDGSVLKPRETDATDQGHGHTTGTWRCHGTINSNGGGTVFQKISE